VTAHASTAGTGRVLERRRAVALARHYREFEGLSIREIADRLGRSPATVKAYFYDPSDAHKRPTNTSKAGGRELRSHARAAAPRENFVSDGPFLVLGAAVQHLR
jgi:Homeodomain-like domain